MSPFIDSLRNECSISPDKRILAGVSGGIDSMFLLSQLIEAGQPVIAAVFDHGLRPEAAEECEFVSGYCAERSILCVCGQGDVRAFAAENRMGIEEAARELRYRFLFRTAAEKECGAVAVAHHANDQAETVLLHILRGSGIDGLCGMRPHAFLKEYSETIPLIRPLLDISRKEIESYAAETGLPYREDRSNFEMEYTRNRVRQDLIPKLAADYNPRIVESLCRLAASAAADKELLDDQCERAIRYAAYYRFDTYCEWSRETYRSYPIPLRKRMLRRILSDMSADLSKIDYQLLIMADHFYMDARYNQTIPFIEGIWLCCEGEKAMVLIEPQRKQWKYPQISQGWNLHCETKQITEKELPDWIEKARKHPETAVLDANQVADYPELRRIRAGESFEPFGMGGRRQKLSDFLINNKVPKQVRADLAVAADEGGIIWVPGCRVSNRCALHEGTRKIMILKLKSKEEPA